MKKIISVLLIFSLLISFCLIQTSYAETTDSVYDSETIEHFKELLDALNIDYTHLEPEDEVTRETFTRILIGLLNSKGSSPATVHGFSDVDESKMNFMLGYAINTGIISKAEN